MPDRDEIRPDALASDAQRTRAAGMRRLLNRLATEGHICDRCAAPATVIRTSALTGSRILCGAHAAALRGSAPPSAAMRARRQRQAEAECELTSHERIGL